MTSLFFQKAARAIVSGLRFMLSKLLDKIMTLLGCIFAKSIILADSVMMITLIFIPLILLLGMMECFSLEAGVRSDGLVYPVAYWVAMIAEGESEDDVMNLSDLKKVPRLEIKSLGLCGEVLLHTPSNISQIQKINNFTQTCEYIDKKCHSLALNATDCAANNPTFLQDIIDIAEKPCEYSKNWMLNDVLYCYSPFDFASIFLGEKTFSTINVLDGERLRYQIIVPRLDNLRAKNKGKKDYKYYER